mgnify:CR=1 FL=1
MLDDLRTGNKVVGLKQSTKALENGTVKTLFLAKDAEEKVINNLKQLSLKNSVHIVYVESMKQLGKACGIEVGAAVACVLK